MRHWQITLAVFGSQNKIRDSFSRRPPICAFKCCNGTAMLTACYRSIFALPVTSDSYDSTCLVLDCPYKLGGTGAMYPSRIPRVVARAAP